MRLYDAQRSYDPNKFAVRYRRLTAEVTSLAWAPSGQCFAGIAAVGTGDGKVSFIDFSIFDQVGGGGGMAPPDTAHSLSSPLQQPTFSEAETVVTHGQKTNDYSIVRDMIEKFPLVVITPGRNGNTLMHMAIRQEDLRVGGGAGI